MKLHSVSVPQFEKFRSSLAADEILNAEGICTAIKKSDPGHRKKIEWSGLKY